MENQPSYRLSTGIKGLDEILGGGLLPRRSYLVCGGPGCGKTTIGLHFLTAGAKNGEKNLFITLEEPEAHIRSNGQCLGFDLERVEFLDLSPTSEFFAEVQAYDIFSPAEVEREPTTLKIIERVKEISPTRVFLDPITQFRYLAPDIFQYRRQVLSFIRFLTDQGSTVMFSSEASPEAPDDDLRFMSDGVIYLQHDGYDRCLSVTKFRGGDFRAGKHAMRITPKGIEVYPRLLPEQFRGGGEKEVISSGVKALDDLLHGGIERQTITLITGPTGVGKTTLGLQFMKDAARRGERSVVYSFEEEIDTMINRAEAVQIPLRTMIEHGALALMKVEPLRWSPDEFAQLVRHQVEHEGAKVVMIDSIAGYELTLRGGDLRSHLHALVKYLQNMNVAVLLISDIHTVVGDFTVSEARISYLADNVIFLRYLEINGEVRKAIGVLKKRLSDFEKTLREFEITRDGIKIGKPLTELRGILLGIPEWESRRKDS